MTDTQPLHLRGGMRTDTTMSTAETITTEAVETVADTMTGLIVEGGNEPHPSMREGGIVHHLNRMTTVETLRDLMTTEEILRKMKTSEILNALIIIG